MGLIDIAMNLVGLIAQIAPEVINAIRGHGDPALIARVEQILPAKSDSEEIADELGA